MRVGSCGDMEGYKMSVISMVFDEKVMECAFRGHEEKY
jgi:hypothetical protein